MNIVVGKLRRFLSDEGGPTAVEYAFMLALILMACIAIVATLGRSLSSRFAATTTAVSS